MGCEHQEKRLDAAFGRIEEMILPCIGTMLDTLLEAAELGENGVSRRAYAAELRTLALQLEALTLEFEAVSPARIDARSGRSVAA